MKGLTWSSNFLSQISCMLALSLFQLHYLPWQLLECVVSLSKWGSHGFHQPFHPGPPFQGIVSLAVPCSNAGVHELCHQQGRQSLPRLQPCPSFSTAKVARQYLSHFQPAWGITGSCQSILNPDSPAILLFVDGMMRKLLQSLVSNSSKFGYPGSWCSRAHPVHKCAQEFTSG